VGTTKQLEQPQHQRDRQRTRKTAINKRAQREGAFDPPKKTKAPRRQTTRGTAGERGNKRWHEQNGRTNTQHNRKQNSWKRTPDKQRKRPQGTDGCRAKGNNFNPPEKKRGGDSSKPPYTLPPPSPLAIRLFRHPFNITWPTTADSTVSSYCCRLYFHANARNTLLSEVHAL